MTTPSLAPAPSYEAPIISPTLADETFFIHPWQWQGLMDAARDVRVIHRSNTYEHGDTEVLACTIDGAPTVFVHLRSFEGKPKECGWAWHRDTLKQELSAITDPQHLAAMILLFGELAYELLYHPATA